MRAKRPPNSNSGRNNTRKTGIFSASFLKWESASRFLGRPKPGELGTFLDQSVMTDLQEEEGPVEIAIVGDLTDSEADLTDRLLGIEQGGECTIYFDSPGGSPYCAVSLMTLI